MTSAYDTIRGKISRPFGRHRRLVLAVVLVALSLFLIFQIVAPLLISTAVVRTSMEHAVARWTGHSVSIGGAPELRFWPQPRISLSDVTITREEKGATRVLGKIEKLSASFKLYQALMGQPVFENLRLTRPSIYVLRDMAGKLDWANDGLLSAAVRQAGASGNAQQVAADLDASVGDVTIRNGRLELLDLASNRSFHMDAINGDIHWPRLSLPANLEATATVNGVPLRFDVSSPEPLLLLAGRDAQTSGSLESPLVSGQFNGLANVAAYSLLSGGFDLSIPDPPAFLTWAGANLPNADLLRNFRMRARLSTDDDALHFENLSLAVNDTEATGILDVTLPPDGTPRLNGTLALDHLDLSALLRALLADTPSVTTENQANLGDLRRQIELDLRFSAQQAGFGPFTLGDVAVSVLNVSGQSRLDIADSDFENGRLTGRITAQKGDFSNGGTVHLSIESADFAAIARGLRLPGPLPLAQGSLELTAHVDRPMASASWKDAAGEMHVIANRGIIPGINLVTLRQLAATKTYFPLSEAGAGDLAFDRLEASATFSGGSAELRSARIENSAESVELTGVVPFADSGLALSANIVPANATGPDFTFFLGGSWPAPVILTGPQPTPKP